MEIGSDSLNVLNFGYSQYEDGTFLNGSEIRMYGKILQMLRRRVLLLNPSVVSSFRYSNITLPIFWTERPVHKYAKTEDLSFVTEHIGRRVVLVFN